MSPFSSLIAELKRRNVLKLVTAYAVGSFIILQLCDILFPALGVSDAVIGYVLIFLAVGLVPLVLFSWMFELTPDGLKRTQEVTSEASISHRTGQSINHIIIGLLSVALLFFAYQYFTTPTVTTETAVTSDAINSTPIEAAEPALVLDARPSIAVLPFVNMSSDMENEYFSDGLSEEVLNLLAQIQELRVAARTSSFFYKGKNINLTEIGDSLNVDHILEGSVRKSGNTVRITAQLISTDDGFHLWSKTFDREINDIFAVQDEIAGEVTRAMQLTLLTDGVVISDRSTTNPESYDLYLRGKNALSSRGLDSVRLSTKLLQQASALDPEYAPALIDMAVAELLLYHNHQVTTLDAALTKAEMALNKVAAMGELTSDYYAALGLYHSERINVDPSSFDKAAEAYEKSIQLNRNNVRPFMWWSTILIINGTAPDRYRRGLELLEKALELDPLNRVANGNKTLALAANGRYQEALSHVERMIQIDPNYEAYHSQRVFFHLTRDDYLMAAETLKTVPRDRFEYLFVSLLILTALNETERFPEVVDTIPPESPAFDIANLAELSLTAMDSEMRAEAEVILLQPDPNFLSFPLLLHFHRQQQHALVKRLIENARPAFREYSPVARTYDFADPHEYYLSAIYHLGETDRAKRYAADLLEITSENTEMGMGSVGTSRARCLLVLDQLEPAVNALVSLHAAGWVGYYEDLVEYDPLFQEALADARVRTIKADIDARLTEQKPVILSTLRQQGAIRSF